MMANNNSESRNELLVRSAESAIDQMKYEIAQEFGAKATVRSNESVGGEITKHLVAMAEQQLGGGFTR